LESGLDIARENPELIETVLELKKLGNDIVEVIGGRPIHPVNVRLGGFHHVPTRDEIDGLGPRLDRAAGAAADVARWCARLPFPDATIEHELVSLADDPAGYPIMASRIVSDRGLDVDLADFESRIEEYQVPHSTARRARRTDGTLYLTGPLARWANTSWALPADVRELATELGIGEVERNPFRSILVRALEVVFAIGEAARILAQYVPPPVAAVEVPARAGVGHGATEAPRGVLFHRYSVDDGGDVVDARIIAPTAQNMAVIEEDVRRVAQRFVDDHGNAALDVGAVDALRHRCEVAIRNHDPCISCATHFLRVDVEGR
jgi:coenzyme F420-reducing hydrogenase alpha subunit